jgi:tRNA U34 2-thiouridine synthase MnmA/TrmU
MIKMAGQRAEREGFQFLATGEVLNQRPMSQTKRSLGIVGKGSGYADWLVRPLSAKLLDETEAERLGWVDRSRLLALSGRSRKPQYELAKKFGITSYPSPGGGCCLTEPNFSARLKDLRNYGQVKDLHAVELLKHGRHFRLSDKVKVLVGRDEKDNAILEKLANPEEILIETAAVMGPAGLITGGADEGEILLAASLCARHSDQKVGLVEMIIKGNGGERRVTVECATPEMVDQLRVK